MVIQKSMKLLTEREVLSRTGVKTAEALLAKVERGELPAPIAFSSIGRFWDEELVKQCGPREQPPKLTGQKRPHTRERKQPGAVTRPAE